MTSSSPDIESIVGRNVKLTCAVLAGNPAPSITWTHLGETVNSTDRIVDDGGGNLYLKNVSVDDEGEYICTASNVGGTSSASLKLDVLGTTNGFFGLKLRCVRTQNFSQCSVTNIIQIMRRLGRETLLTYSETNVVTQVGMVGCVAQLASLAGELTLSCARPAAGG